jgi:hypothetical protein
MNDTIIGAIIGAIFGIVGVVVGFLLNWWRDTRHAADVSRDVRKQLRLECRQNVTALLDYWAKVTIAGVHLPDAGWLQVGTSPQEGEYDKRQRLAHEPMPVWRRLMWESQVSKVAQALNDPAVIARVYALYADLETFAARREELREAFNTPEGAQLAKDYSRWMWEKHKNPTYQEQGTDEKLALFNERTRSVWNECLAIYQRALLYRNSDVIPEEAASPLARLQGAPTR